MKRRQVFAAIALLASGMSLHGISHAAGQPLKLETYNPGEHSIFPVTSSILIGRREVLLVDAQFQRNDAQALVDKIKQSGKVLKTVYISQADPDYYFGLDVIHTAFPKAKIVATKQTVQAIQAQMKGKLAYWGPILKDNAPQALVLPEVIQADHLSIEGHRIETKGLKGPQAERSYLWAPSLKTVLGGVVVSHGIHVWIADTQTPESRAAWRQTLDDIAALKPSRVVPGHFLGAEPSGLDAVTFTGNYISTFEREATTAPDAAALVKAMTQAYPTLGEAASLDLSAKVIKGELKWPQ